MGAVFKPTLNWAPHLGEVLHLGAQAHLSGPCWGRALALAFPSGLVIVTVLETTGCSAQT